MSAEEYRFVPVGHGHFDVLTRFWDPVEYALHESVAHNEYGMRTENCAACANGEPVEHHHFTEED